LESKQSQLINLSSKSPSVQFLRGELEENSARITRSNDSLSIFSAGAVATAKIANFISDRDRIIALIEDMTSEVDGATSIILNIQLNQVKSKERIEMEKLKMAETKLNELKMNSKINSSEIQRLSSLIDEKTEEINTICRRRVFDKR
jgi:hypothetical protein